MDVSRIQVTRECVKVTHSVSFIQSIPYRRAKVLTSEPVAEVLQISYDPTKLSLREIIGFFYRIHDPTTVDKQGHDVGTQYRSAIFTHSAEDLDVVNQVTEEYQKKWGGRISTKVEPIKNFYDAEDYHQEYLFKNPDGYHCETHFVRDL
jgi:peptide-methionine (S)-S-oxide reductase